ncbi:WD40 repeat domain-containing protein, partial [Nocardiopsis nanhaiensis]
LVAGAGLWAHTGPLAADGALGAGDASSAEESGGDGDGDTDPDRCDPGELAEPFAEAADPDPVVPGSGTDDIVGSLAFSHDGSVLAVGGTSGVALWDWEQGTALGLIDLYVLMDSQVTPVFSPDDCRIAYTDEDGVHLYTLATGEHEVLLEDAHPWSVAFSPDGGSLAVSGAGATSLHVLDLESGERQDFEVGETDAGGTASFQEIAFSPGGDYMAATGLWGLWMWDTETWREVGYDEDAYLGSEVSGLALPDDDGGVLYTTEDGPVFAELATGGDGHEFDVVEEDREDAVGNMREFAYHPVTDTLFGLHARLREGEGCTIFMNGWDRSSGQEGQAVPAVDIEANVYTDAPMAATPHPDEEVFAALGLEGGGLVVLDAHTFEEIDTLGPG